MRHSSELPSAIPLLTSLLAQKDGRTLDHCSRVMRYAGRTARVLGLPDTEVEIVRRASVLHDIGKVQVPDQILDHPGNLAPESMELVRSHAVAGEEILRRFPGSGMHEIATLVGAHHERLDGTGYPRGLSGDAIPLGARIIAVCDAFDAMTAIRRYRSVWGFERAIGELIAGAGTQFDKNVVAAFISVTDVRIFRRSS